MSNGARIGRFGQGESNAFGIGKIGTIGATGQDGRAPGAIGGGFGGVAKRMGMGRRQESTDGKYLQRMKFGILDHQDERLIRQNVPLPGVPLVPTRATLKAS